MSWNWQKKEWPYFTYEKAVIEKLENDFLYKAGVLLGVMKHINESDKNAFSVDVLSEEALKTSEIEGEYLNRDSLQSSIRCHLGLSEGKTKVPLAEQGISEMLVNANKTFSQPLAHETLFCWHAMLVKARRDLKDVGRYRTHQEAMQVVSGPVHAPKVHFEAPPSDQMKCEMQKFLDWFNAKEDKKNLSVLTRAGIAHLYFVSIHPFEDGNGRIGRAIVHKVLSQYFKQPFLIALSNRIHGHKKAYYDALEANNQNLEITAWLIYFSKTLLEALEDTQCLINFLVAKAKLYEKVRGQLNPRQEKVIVRVFREGVNGFKGGLSATNYIRIANTSRATATRDLQDLVSKKVLVQKGERKSTRYYLNL